MGDRKLSKDWDKENENDSQDENYFEELNRVDEIVIVPFDEDLEQIDIDNTLHEGNKIKASPRTSDKDLNCNNATAQKGIHSRFFTEEFKQFWLNHKKRNLKIFIAAFFILIFIFFSLAGARISSLLKNINPDNGIDFNNADESYVEEETDFQAMHDVSDASSIDDLLYQWAVNGGEKMSSKNVVNIMLFGVDNYGNEINKDDVRTGSLSDSIVLVSLNKNTKQISLISFMRDSYTYMNIDGKNRFFKINAAYNWGGPATVVKTIEDNYKIAIDKYVCVDFASFPKIIDSLGGVTVEVKQYEAKEIESFFGLTIKYGNPVTLNGQAALYFSRIRKCDSDGDISRTRRQRAVIMAMIKSAKNATTGQVNTALDYIFPNIRTNFTRSEILALGTQAIIQGWANYGIVQMTTPNETNRTSATIKTNFVWVIDYPLEAQAVQTALYGNSNIILDTDRKTALDLLTTKSNSSSSSTTKSASTTIQLEPTYEKTTGNISSTTVETTDNNMTTTSDYSTTNDLSKTAETSND